MREIKFEFVFKNPKDGKVIISAPYTIDEILEKNIEFIQEDCCTCDCQPSGESHYVECNCEDYYADFELIEKRQFIDLKDLKGKEIYQGDILQTTTGKAMVVSWSNKFASFVLKREGWAFSHWFGESCDPNDCVVIGNIHENAELLEGGKP